MVSVAILSRNRNNSEKINVKNQNKISDFFSSNFFQLLITILFFSSMSISIPYFTLSFVSRFLGINFLSLSSFDFLNWLFLISYITLPVIFYCLIYFIINKYYKNSLFTVQENVKYPLHIYNSLALFFFNSVNLHDNFNNEKSVFSNHSFTHYVCKSSIVFYLCN